MTHGDKVYSLTSDPSDVSNSLAVGFVDSWNQHDMACLAELFHSDATFVNVVGVLMKDREEIVRIHSEVHAGPFRASTLEIEVENARKISPEVVVAHFRSTLKGDERNPGGVRESLLTFVIEYRGDGWRIIAAQNTNIPAKQI